MAVWEMYQSQLKATGEEISQARHNAAQTQCGICQQLGHNRKTCRYYESWFNWDNDDHAAFQDAFQDSLGRIDDP